MPHRAASDDGSSMRRYSICELLIAACAGVAAFTAFMNPAFAASVRPGGAGSNGVSGYRVSDISYEIDSRNIHQLSSVSFRLDRPARTAHVALGGVSGACSVTGTLASCSFAKKPLVEDVARLEVVAAA
jgi:hypothetical protein